MACDICAYADEHFWWGPPLAAVVGYGGTHCRDCHRSWHGRAEAHCVRCHAHFSSGYAADLHLVRGECADPGTLRSRNGNPVLKSVESRLGITWTGWSAERYTGPERPDRSP